MRSYTLTPIGIVHASRDQAEDDAWDTVDTRIVLDPQQLERAATEGLASFSHVEVLYIFDPVEPARVCRGARHPRGRQDWPAVGILAQRAKARPNCIGVTVCRLLAVNGLEMVVQGLDAIDQTPVIDIGPYMVGFARRGNVRQPPWPTS